ncbi:MAG: exodeoxyribonuclease VII large subunit [Legionella sp.]|nr:exodeoxyribonuclease VII large subunit [Legionella sp.]
MKQEFAPLTVSQLNRQVRSWLEHDLGEVNVLGELSNLSKPASGHFYFTLKDTSAQLRCVFFRSHHTGASREFTDGQQVIAKGKLSLYEARGDYQLIVQELVQAGLGELYQQFERLKLKLEQQGLFAPHRKKPLSRYPVTIAVITSGTGAALRDILSTLARRYPVADVHIYPCEVQGKNAAPQLINAILQANKDCKSDVILLARGGGSIEDLWPFNDEQLALTISQSKIPIVSGVGHEIDFTIADFVADLRAATPTAAAEAVTPDKFELMGILASLIRRMLVAVTRTIQHQKLVLSHQLAKISSPEQLISSHWQTVDYLERQLNQLSGQLLRHKQHHLQVLVTTLNSHNPKSSLQQLSSQLQQAQTRLHQIIRTRFHESKQSFMNQLSTLHAVSPLATLDRGYCIATHKNTVIFSSDQVHAGDTIKLQLAKGRLSCNVINKAD